MRRINKETPAPPETGAAVPPVVRETHTTTTVRPAEPAAAPEAQRTRRPKEDVNVWFSKMEREYRAKHVVYYLYRKESSIIVVEPLLDGGRARGSMLYKFKPEDIDKFPAVNFYEELQLWVKEEFGGGAYELQINDNKQGTKPYCLTFSFEGKPKLSNREAYADGAPRDAGGAPDQWAVRTLIEFIDKKLDSVKGGQADPGAAFSQITQAVMDSNSKALGFILANLPKADPMQQMEQLKMMLEISKSFQPAVAAPVAAAPPLTPVQQMREIMELEKLMRERQGEPGGITPATLTTAVAEGFKQIGNVASKKVSGWVEFGQALAPFAPVLQPLVTEAVAFFRARRQGQQPGAPQPGLRIVARGGPAGQQPQAPAGAGGPAVAGSAGGPIPGGQFAGGGQIPPAGVPPQAAVPPVTGPAQPMAPQNGEWNIPQQAVDDMTWQMALTRVVDMLEHNRSGEDAAAMLDDAFPEIAAQFEMMSLVDLQKMLDEDPILSRAKGHPKAFAFGKAFYDFFHQAQQPETIVQ